MAFIEFRGVHFHFGSSPSVAPVIEDFDLAIHEHEFFVLLGPSGCGKTTVLNMLAGYERPVRGVIELAGQQIAGPGRDRMVIFQGDDSLYPWLTVFENIEFGSRLMGVPRDACRRQGEQYIRLVGLTGHERKYPSQLSGGMKQRVQLARALACDSQLLLMDEPFAALDAQMRSVLQDELVQIWAATRKTILFITHDIAEAILLADRIGIMRAGPASAIREITPIDLPRPRRRGDPAFGALYERINSVVSQEVQRVLGREITR
jgi:NitT/TauT family transport system ATP-binding protein